MQWEALYDQVIATYKSLFLYKSILIRNSKEFKNLIKIYMHLKLL